MWRDKSVMVVEDDEGIREFLGRALGTELGAYTVVARDGQEALKWAERLRPSVIVLDLLLPTIDGFEVAHRIKGDPRLARTCIIAVSAARPPAPVAPWLSTSRRGSGTRHRRPSHPRSARARPAPRARDRPRRRCRSGRSPSHPRRPSTARPPSSRRLRPPRVRRLARLRR